MARFALRGRTYTYTFDLIEKGVSTATRHSAVVQITSALPRLTADDHAVQHAVSRSTCEATEQQRDIPVGGQL